MLSLDDWIKSYTAATAVRAPPWQEGASWAQREGSQTVVLTSQQVLLNYLSRAWLQKDF